MKIETDAGLFLYAGSPPNGTAWAVFPLFAWMPAWMATEPDWVRAKVRVHEKVHFRQQGWWCGLGAVLVDALSALLWAAFGWATLLWTALGALSGLIAWYVRYGVSPDFRLDVEVEAEAAEKRWLVERGKWEPTIDNLQAYVTSHLNAYYGRPPLLGTEPPAVKVRRRFVRALVSEGVPVEAGVVR